MSTMIHRPAVANAARAGLQEGPACPVPLVDGERVQLGHGSGGKLSAGLLRDVFLPHLGNDILARLGDGAVLSIGGETIVMSTDTFVVTPLEFPGGDIGSLSVHGTVNDIAMMGARPAWISAGFVLEEGLELSLLDRLVRSMGRAAQHVGVTLVTGDTRVVERGKADGVFINTTGIGILETGFRPAPERARAGDSILVSGPIGSHGIAIMAARNALGFETTIRSDSASLVELVEILRGVAGDNVHALRDPTRGGVASTLNEVAVTAGIGIEIEEEALPVPGEVAAACEMLGLDPLYVANEGIMIAFVSPELEQPALRALRAHPLGREAQRIGRACEDHAGMVVMRTGMGGRRMVDMLPGDQLPRIC
jgi:hydrogenase expression/formation protein HypE